MEEIWKPIGIKYYQISNLGNVKGLNERLLKPYNNNSGYLCINIDGGTKLVHCLLMKTFIGERPIGMDIDHINRITYDNRLENLRYCTRSENMINRKSWRADILETNPIERKRIQSKLNARKYYEAKKLLSMIK